MVAGSMAQEQRLNFLTHNLANTTTVGFKYDRPSFEALMAPIVVGEVHTPGQPLSSLGSLNALATRHTPQQPRVSMSTDFSQGPLRETGNALDLALNGEGFFTVQSADDELLYTRQGTFTLNAQGQLVTQQGLLVQGRQGPIRVGTGRVEIEPNGQVRVDDRIVDRLQLIDFPQPYPLVKQGDTLFRLTDPQAQGVEATNVQVHQGSVELSNGPLILLLTAVIQTSRAHQGYQRVIQAFDDTAAKAVNDLGKT